MVTAADCKSVGLFRRWFESDLPHMFKYNNKYSNVFYEEKNWRLYNELTTTSLDALYSETQIKLIELIEKYDFKIFYFNCKPATNNKLIINNKFINLDSEDVNKIKINQTEDFYYIYKNKICEVFYSFLKLDNKNNYYFDFMLVVNKNFNLNDIYNYRFKSIKIESVKEILINDLTFELIQNIFEKRVITINNCGPSHDKEYYNLREVGYGFDNFMKEFKNNSLDFDYNEYLNFNSFHFFKKFDQERCAKGCFKLLCSQIWTVDRVFFKEKNKYGLRIDYTETYNINTAFLTNFAELVNCVSIDLSKKDELVKEVYYTYSCLRDNFRNQGILEVGFHKEYMDNKKPDFNNLIIIEKNE